MAAELAVWLKPAVGCRRLDDVMENRHWIGKLLYSLPFYPYINCSYQ